MNRPENCPPSELELNAAHLFSEMDSVFQDNLEPLGFSAELELPACINPADKGALQDRELVKTLTGREVDTCKTWQAEIGYSPTTENLVFTKLSLPLKSPSQQESLNLVRTPQDKFIALYANGEENTLCVTGETETKQAIAIPADYIDGMLARAGMYLPRFYPSREELTLALAEVASETYGFHIKEERVIPIDSSSQMSLTRNSHYNSIDPRQRVTTSLRACTEQFTGELSANRSQQIVEFRGDDYYACDLPSIYAQELTPEDSYFVGEENPSYRVIAKREFEASPQLLEALSEDFTESLMGANPYRND